MMLHEVLALVKDDQFFYNTDDPYIVYWHDKMSEEVVFMEQDELEDEEACATPLSITRDDILSETWTLEKPLTGPDFGQDF